MQTVLVVSDDQEARTLLRTLLDAEGFRVVCAPDVASGLAVAIANLPNLILIDVNMSKMDGLHLLQNLRQQKNTAFIPIVIVTFSASESDVVLALERGADDYIVRPIRPRELIARVRAVLRRSGDEVRAMPERRIGPLAIDPGAHTVTYQGEPIPITHTEFRIIDLLARNAGLVVTREQIMQASRESEHPVLRRSVDLHIRSLRKKLKGGGSLILTVRAVGYRLKRDEELT